MIQTTHYCAKCGSDHLRRNGSNNGRAKYQCTAYRHQGLFVPAAVRKAAQYAQVDTLLVERNSQRSIVRFTGVARMTIAKRIKKSGAPLAGTAFGQGPAQAVGSARTRRIVELCVPQEAQGVALAGRRTGPAAYCGLDAGQPGRSAPAPPLAGPPRALPSPLLALYRPVEGLREGPAALAAPALKGEGQTSIVEAINCSLRQHCGVLVRKSCSFSKSLAMHTARIKIVIDNYNLTLQ